MEQTLSNLAEINLAYSSAYNNFLTDYNYHKRQEMSSYQNHLSGDQKSLKECKGMEVKMEAEGQGQEAKMTGRRYCGVSQGVDENFLGQNIRLGGVGLGRRLIRKNARTAKNKNQSQVKIEHDQHLDPFRKTSQIPQAHTNFLVHQQKRQGKLQIDSEIREYYKLVQIYQFIDSLVILNGGSDPVLSRVRRDLRNNGHGVRSSRLPLPLAMIDFQVCTKIHQDSHEITPNISQYRSEVSSEERSEYRVSSCSGSQSILYCQPELEEQKEGLEQEQEESLISEDFLRRQNQQHEIKCWITQELQNDNTNKFLGQIIEIKRLLTNLKPLIQSKISSQLSAQMTSNLNLNLNLSLSFSFNPTYFSPQQPSPSSYHICTKCWQYFDNGHRLGGHMSKKHPGSSLEYKNKRVTDFTKRIQRNRRKYLKRVCRVAREREGGNLGEGRKGRKRQGNVKIE